MTKVLHHVSEDSIEEVIDSQEKEGWQLVSATQSTPASSIGGADAFLYRHFPATYLLFFRKPND